MSNRNDRPYRSLQPSVHPMVYLAILALLIISLIVYSSLQERQTDPRISDYEIYSKQAFNQPSFYPANPAILPTHYRAIGEWTGRLILPSNLPTHASDAVEFEVYHAPPPYEDWVGTVVRLTWSDTAQIQEYVATVSQTIQFTKATRQSEAQGILHPRRLDGKRVGPLQSLAGARLLDDVTVMLRQPIEVRAGNSGQRPMLLTTQEPVQIPGRYYGLVSVLRSDRGDDRLQVQHFNPGDRQFDGAIETVLMPQVTAGHNGIPPSTVEAIEQSPFNQTGWYIYGAPNAEGVFVVQAIVPRALLRLQPGEIVLGERQGLDYINQRNWNATPAKKGTGWTVLLDPVAPTPEAALNDWQEGDRAIVLHLFGGIGGNKAEPTQFGVVTGHFAYGTAQVGREPLTGDLWFEILYQQVYAHNTNGIVSGTLQWAEYMGNLQRGWLGTRPVADIVVKLDAVTQDYNFGGVVLSPLTEFVSNCKLWQRVIVLEMAPEPPPSPRQPPAYRILTRHSMSPSSGLSNRYNLPRRFNSGSVPS
ncbi:MAG: hypothetical protein HC881_14385, partial [Leptolyngbyaceae cyanobacterium SL_7_1]|nr:hypothetical protein [Leptolyngbyaceae cyanobacterium SL_7_1]